MSAPRILLIGTRFDNAVILRLIDRFNIVGILIKDRNIRMNLPGLIVNRLDDALSSPKPNLCCILSCYPSIHEDLTVLMASEIPVLSAGPIPGGDRITSDDLVTVSSPQRWSGVYKSILEQSRRDAFGNPVFLRYISSGGHSFLGAWWGVCQALSQAMDLLQPDIRTMHVISIRRGQKYHVNVTLSMTNRSNGQLTIVPEFLEDERDYTFLGSGGLLNYDSEQNSTGIMYNQKLSIQKRPEFCSYTAWLQSYINDPVAMQSDHHNHLSTDPCGLLYKGIRTASRTGKPISTSI